jgi:hypothetical protein
MAQLSPSQSLLNTTSSNALMPNTPGSLSNAFGKNGGCRATSPLHGRSSCWVKPSLKEKTTPLAFKDTMWGFLVHQAALRHSSQLHPLVSLVGEVPEAFRRPVLF